MVGAVDQHKQALNRHAYLLVHKYLAAVGKEGADTFEFRKNLRKGLDIDANTNKDVIAEVQKFKEQGGAHMMAQGGAAAAPAYGGGGVKAAKSKGAGAAMGGAALPPLAAQRSVSKSGSKSAKGKPDISSLPPLIGMKVQRWWPNENSWFEAVITDYNPQNHQYRLTYHLGSQTESYEDLNLDTADPVTYSITQEKVNLLTKTGSAAVNNSEMLKPFLLAARSASKPKPKPKKKRKSKSSSEEEPEEEDDDDMFDD